MARGPADEPGRAPGMKGARLSLARIGSYWQQMSKQFRLTAGFVREHLPPRLPVFKWLTAPQK